MKVLITGGTGFVGSHLANFLAGKGGLSVSVVSRDPYSSTVELKNSINRVEGDVTVPGSLDFSGVDVVIHLAAISPLWRPVKTSYRKVHVEGTRNVVAEAEERGVNRFIYMSVLNTDPEGSTEFLRTRGEAERIVENSLLDFTVINSALIFGDGGEVLTLLKRFIGNFPVFALVGGGKTRFQPIFVGDVVLIVFELIREEKFVNQLFELGGPEILDLREIASKVFYSFNKKPRFVSIPMSFFKFLTILSGFFPFSPVGLDQFKIFKFDNVVEDRGTVRRFDCFDNGLTTVDSYLGL